MTTEFNPPPGWPTPPPGWQPSPGWTPDPSWPPPPPGWNLWVEPSQAGRPGNRSTIVLVVVTALATVSLILTKAGAPALVIGIVALILRRRNPVWSRRLTRIGWWVFGALVVLTTVATIIDYASS